MPSRTLMFATAAIVYGTLAQGGFYRAQAVTVLVLVLAATFAEGVRPVVEGWRTLPGPTRLGILGTGSVMAAALVAAPSANAITPIAIHSTGILGSLVGIRLAAKGEFDDLLRVLSMLGVAVAVLGLVGVATHHVPLALESQGHWRAASTLTYANAMAAMLVPAMAAGVLRLRAGHSTASVEVSIMLGGAIATMSRGSGLGLVIGILVVLAWHGASALRGLVRPVLGGLVIGASVMPSIFGDARPLIAGLGVIVGAVIAGSRWTLPTILRRWPVVLALAASTVAVAVVIAPGTASSLVERTTNEDRSQIWQATLDATKSGPLFGQGLGQFEVFEERYGQTFRIAYAHNEILQALVESGWPGGIALGVGSILGLLGYVRCRSDDDRWMLGLLVVVAFGAHGLTDFVWHVPAVLLATALWYGGSLSDQTRTVSQL